jgi:8-oxo-dGTP pyrophosphatase MutT (NUDIX family)
MPVNLKNSINHLSEEQIVKKINSVSSRSATQRWMQNIERYKPDNKIQPKHAAVLVPLFQVKGIWKLLFTRRAQNMVDHSGQVAFPGGQVDESDLTFEDVAKREAYEEIGLRPEDTRILGRLNEIYTITHYIVTPIVGVISWPYQFVLSRTEVSRIFSIPLTWLVNQKHYQISSRSVSDDNIKINTIIYQPYKNETLWGVSALIVQDLLTILLT